MSDLGPPDGTYSQGTEVTLTPSPDAGWVFSGWSDDLAGSDNPATLVMDADKSVTATFTEQTGTGVVAFEETGTGTATSSATVTTGANLTAVSGHFYLAAVTSKPAPEIVSVSGLGLTWVLLRDQCSGRNQPRVAVWIGQGTPTSADPVTATFASAPGASAIAVSRFSGVDPLTPTGSLVSGNTTQNGACSGGSDGAIIFGAAAMRNKTHTPVNGFTERTEIAAGSGGSAAGLAVVDQSIAGSANVSFAGNFSSNVDWAAIAVEIKPSQTTLPLAQFDQAARFADTETLPTLYELYQNYPNPFNPTTTIGFSLPRQNDVTLSVYDVRGKEVARLVDSEMAPGRYSVTFDGSKLSSGLYFYTLRSGAFTRTVKLTMIK